MEKARKLLKDLSLEQLVEAFEETTTNNDISIIQVRGWLMGEIASRDPKGFEKWLDSFTGDNQLRKYVLCEVVA